MARSTDNTGEVTSEAGEWRRAWHRAFRSQRAEVDVRSAVLGALITGVPLAVGVATGHETLGLFASLGGLNVALGLSAGTRADRLRWGLVALVGASIAVAIATMASGLGWLLVLMTFVWVAAWALVRAAGPAGIVVAFVNSAVFIIVGGQTATVSDALPRTIAFAAGGIASLGLFLALATPGSDAASGDSSGMEGATAPEAQPGPDPVPVPDPGPASEPAPGPSLGSLRAALAADPRNIRYATRAGVVIAVATAFELAVGLTQGYWVPLAGVAVIQPDARATRVRAVQRAAGTMIGVAVAAVAVGVTRNQGVLVAMVFVASGGLFALKERGYHWLVILLTPTVIIMLAAVSSSRWTLIESRVIDNAIGIVLVLVLLAGWDYVARRHDGPRSE